MRFSSMKYFLLILVMTSFSCRQKRQPKPAKELMRFVNDQNDGFNAFNISIFDDSSYKKDQSLFAEDVERGEYSMNDTAIYFTSGKLNGGRIAFEKDRQGRLQKPILYRHGIMNTPMRIIFDSLPANKQFAPK